MQRLTLAVAVAASLLAGSVARAEEAGAVDGAAAADAQPAPAVAPAEAVAPAATGEVADETKEASKKAEDAKAADAPAAPAAEAATTAPAADPVATPAPALDAVATPAAEPAPAPAAATTEPAVVDAVATETIDAVKPAPAPATEETIETVDLATEPSTEPKKGFSLSWGYSQSLANSTFVKNLGARNPYWSNSLELAPAYSIDSKSSVSLKTSWSYEFTKSNFDNGRSFSLTDWVLLYNRTFFTEKEDGFKLSAGPRASLPLSWESRAAGRISTASAGASVSKTFHGQNVAFTLSASKSLNRYAAVVVEDDETIGDEWNSPRQFLNRVGGASTSDVRAIAFCRSGEQFCLSGGRNTDFGFSGGLMVSGDIPWVPKLSYSVMYSLQAAWKYSAPEDEFTPKETDEAGERVANNSNRGGDMSVGSLGFSYELNDDIGLGLSFDSMQPALWRGKNQDPDAAADWSLRFPFWDFVTPANGFSSISFSVSGSI